MIFMLVDYAGQEAWHCPQAGLLVVIWSLLSELFLLKQFGRWPSANIRRTLGLCEIAQAHVVCEMNRAKSLYTSQSGSSSFCCRSGVPSSSTSSSVNNLELPVTKKACFDFWGIFSIINTPTGIPWTFLFGWKGNSRGKKCLSGNPAKWNLISHKFITKNNKIVHWQG